MELSQFIIPLAILLVAVVYSSVGHGGASGYLAVLAIAGIDPDITRPTALVLNLFVASIASYHFWRTGNFSARLFISFAIASIPFAFLGGVLRMPTHIYKYVLGGVLAFAAARLVWRFSDDREFRLPSLPVALFAGAVIGLLSGLVGVGGGIFLTPVMMLMGWANTKTAAGVSAVFILVNSAAGLAGRLYKDPHQFSILPGEVWVWISVAVIGGIFGSMLGSRRFDSLTLRYVLGGVLLFASVKLIFI